MSDETDHWAATPSHGAEISRMRFFAEAQGHTDFFPLDISVRIAQKSY